MDHVALQWARTYENSNRRLAACGTVFSAYTPGLEIIHRPRHKHSNMNPLSCLPWIVPSLTSPLKDESSLIQINTLDISDIYSPAQKMGMSIFTLADCLEEPAHAFSTANTTNTDQPMEETNRGADNSKDLYERANELPGHMYTQMADDVRQKWIQGYLDNPSL